MASATATTLPDALLHLPLDNISGGTSPDLSTNGTDATVGADVTTTDGPIGGGVQLAAPGGSSGNLADGLRVPQVGDGSPFTEVSISFWYRAASSDHDGYLFAWGGSYNAANHISLYLDARQELRLRVHDGQDTGSIDSLTPAGFQDGDWHHLVIAKDGTGASVYFDGTLIHTTVNGDGAIDFQDALYLGTNQRGTFGAESVLDDLQIYARALDASDVATLFAVGNNGGGGGG
ncbi:MAG: LamG domain-containing protein, partial [Acidobacteriota bacterium]